MADTSVQNETNVEEEEKKMLEKFIKGGFSLFTSEIEDVKQGKMKSSSVAGMFVGVAAGGVVATASMFVVPSGGGAVNAGAKVKSMTDAAMSSTFSNKNEEKRKNVLSWTNSLDEDNERLFLETVSQGLAYICVAYKDQIKLFHPNDANNETFFSDVFRRVLKHMKENPRNGSSPLTAEEFFNAFIKGRSTPMKAWDQLIYFLRNFKRGRGLYLTGIQGEQLNTQTLFENPGYIIPQGENKIVLSVQNDEKNKESKQVQDFRLKYDFEECNLSSKLNENEFEPIYTDLKNDWRLHPNSVHNFLSNINRRVIKKKMFDQKWWPQKESLPKPFYKRKCEYDGEYLIKDQHATFSDENTKKIAFSGGPGVGKSVTAISFALKHENDYDHIFWLDGGKESGFQKLFRILAAELKIEGKEMALEDLLKGCFNRLQEFHCLWIFDNAECYVGEKGIKNLLPEKYNKFHVIITSRNREWGNENAIDLGKIQEISIDIFSEVEASEFMQANINEILPEDKVRLEGLCYRLGYLPLTLQIAIASINQNKISVQDFIMSLQTNDKFVETDFYYDGNNIYKSMSLSLDLIKSLESKPGNLAMKILNIFSYLTEANVKIEFFTILEKDVDEDYVLEALELLERRSLVTVTRIEDKIHCLSINPTLQQVIRKYNGEESKNDALKKILNCAGFLEYKLIPYCFADNGWRKHFPTLKSELIEQINLQKLLEERRFREAAEFSRLVSTEFESYGIGKY